MSTVDKMLIKGIRSFDPENKNVITFFKPLTLIVGSNGAGKTTIIECLKVACTGELPPNARSGHSFVHDPKVAGETETKGQIKLRFKTAARKDVVCIRSFQLTQKATKMEYKAIESVLQTINPHTGEKVCLSYRCADMDREIPALMGVSKAVLENVIFVHQDEANWPLQDPSTLKKKFDDIFSATRYTKALEVIKKLHKDQNQEIKTYKLKLENLQTLKDAAYKLRESIAHDQEKTEALKSQMEESQKDIQKLDSKIQHNEATLKELRKLKEKIVTKTAEKSMLIKEREKQYAALTEENEDTDEELMEWKVKFEERIAMLNSKVGKLNRDLVDINSKIDRLRGAITESTRNIAKLETEANAHDILKRDRDSKLQSIFRKHNLGAAPDSPLSDEAALNLTARVQSRLTDLNKDLADKMISDAAKVKTAWDQYTLANNSWRDAEAKKNAKAEIMTGILNSIEQKEKERRDLELRLSRFNLAEIDRRENELHSKLKKITDQIAGKGFDLNIQQKQSEVNTLEKKIKDVHREKDVLAAESEERIKLSLKKGELETLRKKHKKILDDHKDKFRGVLKGRLPLEKDLKREIFKAQSDAKREYDDLSSKARDAEKEVSMLQTKIAEVNDNLSKLHKDRDSRRRFIELKLQSIDQHSGIDSYFRVLDSAREKRDSQKSKYNMADGMRQMFDPFEKVARAHHICPCCDRPFSAEEEDEFVRKQRIKAASSAEHLKALAVETSNIESLFEQLDKLRMVYAEYDKINKESIPLAEKNLNELNVELDKKNQVLDDVRGVLALIKTDKESIDRLIQPVEIADRLLEEIQASQTSVDELEYRLDFSSQGVKTKDDLLSELDSLQHTKDCLQIDLEKLREEQRYMGDDQKSVQARWHAAREDKTIAAAILQNVEKVEKELDSLAERKSQEELDEKHLSEAVGPLKKESEKLLRHHDDLNIKLTHERNELSNVRSNYEREVDEILRLNSEIKSYYDSKKGEKLKEFQDEHTAAEVQLEERIKGQEKLLAEQRKNEELLISQAQLKRNIEDNLNYRKTIAHMNELEVDIESLEKRIFEMGGISAAESEAANLSQERDRLLSELNRFRGTVSVYQSNISKNKVDLKQAQYKEIDKRYFDQLIQLKTTEMANKDLDRYYNALDKALMRFHTMKMEEINKIIRELWQQTYRGQDIDYISIHSDSEGAGTRSYSYRVIMQTGDAELEMRGRCSAGQKVLASLIIRLALAETFCLNCGILALDEPTTNLDGPNSESLAAALLRIMEDRKGQENFQLIIITHDERFAQLIGQRQHAEKYYRIAKDDLQHSIIEAQEIFD